MLDVAVTGSFAPNVERLEVVFNDLYVIPVPLSTGDGNGQSGTVRTGQVRDLFGEIVAAVVAGR